MKQQRLTHRRAAWLLLAAVALPSTPLLAQEPPVTDVTVPPVTVPDPVVVPQSTPPVTQTTPTPTQNRTPAPATAPTRATEAPAAPERRATTRTARTTARAAAPARPEAPARRTTQTAAPAPTPAPAAETAAPAALPPAALTPAPLPVPAQEEAADSGPSILTYVIGGGLLLLLGFAFLNMLRHRRRRAEPEEVYYDAPPVVREPDVYDAPMMAAPVAAGAMLADDEREEVRHIEPEPDFAEQTMAPAATEELAFDTPAEEPVAVAEGVAVADADPADVEALAASSAAPDGRPWLEFLMRPVRAGTSNDSAIVEFELTVGNTGDAPARDVRISTFMFAAGSAQESEMERMLIDPPANSAVTEVDIAAGDATRVEAAMALPREALSDKTVLPVVVADARYRLPDGTEGRTFAQFEVGIPSAEGLDPFPVDRASGLLEGIEARLHGEPERV